MSYSSGTFVSGLTGYVYDRNGNIRGTTLVVSGATTLASATADNMTVNQQTLLGATGTCTFGSNITSGQGLSINTGTTNYIFPNATNLAIVSIAALGNGTITGLSNITVSNIATLYLKQPTYSGFTATNRLGLLTEGAVYINNSTVSSSNTTGALVIDGGLGIGGNLNVAGTISGAVSTTRVIVSAGSSASPAVVFTGTSTGIYYNTGSTSLVLVNGGTDMLTIPSTGKISISGSLLIPAIASAASPAVAIGVAANDGIYSSGAGNINIATAGISRVLINATRLTASVPIQSVLGLSTNCGFQLAAINDGLYGIAAGNPAISAAGSSIMNWTTGYASISITGNVSAPSLIWGDVSTGFYRPAVNQLAISISGALLSSFTSSGISIAAGSLMVASSINQIILGTTNTVTLTTSVAAARTYTFPDAGGSAAFVMNSFTGGQTIAGGLTFTGTTIFSSSIAATAGSIDFSGSTGIFKTSTGAITLGPAAISITGQATLTAAGSSTASSAALYVNPAGTTLSGTSNFYFSYFALPPTSATSTGIVSTVAIGGSPANASGQSLALYIVAGRSLFADTTASSSVSTGAVVITGGLGVGGNLNVGGTTAGPSAAFSALTNQIVLGTTFTTTLNAVAPAASRVYTIPDAGGAASFVMNTSTGGQTISGVVSIGGLLTASAGFAVSSGNINFGGSTGTFSSPTGAITLGAGAIFLTGAATFSGGVASSAGNFDLSGSGGTFKTTTGAITLGPGAVSLTGAATFAASGNAVPAAAAVYVAPSSTTFSGSNNYYFTYLAQPATTATTSGLAATFAIAGSPAGAANSYSLYVIAGVSRFADTTASASSTTGAVVVAGGVGVAGDLRVGGTIYGTVNGTINTSAVSLTSTTNQIILGTGTTTTLNSVAPIASRVYTIPDAGSAASFIMSSSTGGQTIAGAMTLGSTTISGNVAMTTGNFDLSGSSGTFKTTTGQNIFQGSTYQSFLSTPLTANTTLSPTASTTGGKYIIPLNSTSTFTITLPTTTGNSGLMYTFINIGTATVNISTNNTGTEYYNGNATVTSIIMAQYDNLSIICYGTNWYMI